MQVRLHLLNLFKKHSDKFFGATMYEPASGSIHAAKSSSLVTLILLVNFQVVFILKSHVLSNFYFY